MGKHDLKCKELQVKKIINKEDDSVIDVSNVLRQTGTFEYDDFDLIPLWVVKLLISQSQPPLTFTQADLVSDGGGGFTLPINLTGTQITAAVKSSNGFAKAGGDVQSINGFTSNEAQTITVFVLGEPGPATIPFKNFASVNALYQIGSDPVATLLAGETINITKPSSIVIAFASAPSGFEYGLVNQNNTFLTNQDGGDRVQTIPHEWNLPSDTTLINIAGVP